MITREERLFVESFIAILAISGIKEIPFQNAAYIEGVTKLKNMVEYFESKLPGIGIEDITILFVKRPITGEFVRFDQAIRDLDGLHLSIFKQKILIEIQEWNAKVLLLSKCAFPSQFMYLAVSEFVSAIR